MEKKVLEQYIDACELIKETEKDIRRLKKKRQTIVQTNVSGSNPDFPYNPQHFKIAGTAFTYEEDARLRHEEKILEERREQAQRLKVEADQEGRLLPNEDQGSPEETISGRLRGQDLPGSIQPGRHPGCHVHKGRSLLRI